MCIYCRIIYNIHFSYAEKWRPRRKLLTPTFHYDILKDFVDVFNRQAQILIQRLQLVANTESVGTHSFVNDIIKMFSVKLSILRHMLHYAHWISFVRRRWVAPSMHNSIVIPIMLQQ